VPIVESTLPGDLRDVPPELGEHARYRIMEFLGSGGMGKVFKAVHRLMQRPVAIKVINRDLVRRPEAVERFRREVKAAARLSHPNIVTAYDAEEAGGTHFLVMEFVEGTNLAREVAGRGPLPVGAACDFTRQAALGLQHAFERGMVHRDIKPQNLILTPQGQVKVLDFGLARFAWESIEPQPPQAEQKPDRDAAAAERSLESCGGGLTADGLVIGSADFIAPEQVANSREADIRADIYSLGCTLYFLLMGEPPFPRGSIREKLNAHAAQMPRPLDERRPDVPGQIVAVIDRMIAKDPRKRYASPQQVADALAVFAGRRGSPPRRTMRAAMAAMILLAVGLALIPLIFYRVASRPAVEPGPVPPDIRARFGDLRVARPFFLDEFDDTSTAWHVESQGADGTSGYARGRYFFRAPAGRALIIWGRSPEQLQQMRNFTCEVVGRAVGPPGGQWGLYVWKPDSHQTAAIKLDDQGKVVVESPLGKPLLKATSAAARRGDAFNALWIIFRERTLEVFVNSERIGEPLDLGAAMAPCRLHLLGMSQEEGLHAEFERITVWQQ
jgi:tRNA A-37 threonylcarbamoyl transferase component Bud32